MTPTHLQDLNGTDFDFLCMERAGKQPIVEQLEDLGVAFVDVGLGVYVKNGYLGGILRTTTSTPAMRAHVRDKKRISFVTADSASASSPRIRSTSTTRTSRLRS
ncbi:MAG: hypothetical protein B7Y35_06880 [Sphingomonadales bacterium 28-64-96]|nr:MAG: hypothetical protein B7Y35_06880 [Sphingomonadales bacterium 28-64-96]